jgi:hypothetical protein
LVLGIALALAGCDRPRVRLICHNANCVEPTDPANDDTLEALAESLALEFDGKPALDGIEIDSFWRGTDGVCLFAHDLDAPRITPMTEAAAAIAAHLARPAPLTFSGAPLRVFVELKSHVGVDKSERHTPEQLVQHAACAWDVYTTIANAAVANGHEVEIIFGAFNPDLLRTVLAMQPASLPVPYRFTAIYGIPKPLDSETRPLDDYAGLPIGVIEMHAQWIHDAQLEGYLTAAGDKDIELVLWMFSATVETLAAIEQYEPDMVNTSEARLMRGWLEH